MWIDFTCTKPYMIKIYIGAVNAISGEPAVETAATKLRRLAKLASANGSAPGAKVSLQDYVVVPDQPWLDGISDSNGTVRQFVTMPFGSRHSVEAQVTDQEATGGLQFEITPYDVSSSFPISVKSLTGKVYTIQAGHWYTVDRLKLDIQCVDGTPPDQQRLIYGGKQMEGMTDSYVVLLFKAHNSKQTAGN